MKNKVAIVDDSDVAREFTRICLSELGFSCVASYSDPRTALEDLLKGEVEVDIILTDFMMPEIDGLEFCRLVHQTTTHRKTPILMVSSNADDDLLRRALEAGAKDCLKKPVSFSEIEMKLRRYSILY
ncbi:response regulator [Pseudooceanicola marinus]|uniref:response regulator n=1 Tax=Pseudooceanicola marinus TaxID=396013 RepID=UPI000A2703F2|nr:response regulator [Pseudooceanicola marinus]PJE26248.1 response regulator [Pseudooceanicola marinus]